MPLLNHECPTPTYIHALMYNCHSLMHDHAQLLSLHGCQNGCNCRAKPTGHFFWPIQPSNMLGTTTMPVLHQPFPSCKVEKFFN